MRILILISFLSVLGALIGVEGILFCFSILIILPILNFNFAFLFSDYFLAYIVFILLLTIGFAVFRLVTGCKQKFFLYSDKPVLANLESTIVFNIFFIFFYSLSLKWRDFYSLGERMRDLALVGAGINDPIFIQEPWFAGLNLNYYAYWYRFANLLSVLLGLKHFEVYHILVSFAPSFLAICLYFIFKQIFCFSRTKCLSLSALALLASNPAGVQYFFMRDSNWWYPSRVIEGTIGEFPAWSFLLGDAHPHFLNVGSILFFMLLTYLVLKSQGYKVIIFICSSIVPVLFFKNANMWEVPIWGLIFSVFLFFVALQWYFKSEKFQNFSIMSQIIEIKFLIYFILIVLISFGLYQMQKNFVPIHYPIGFVKNSTKPIDFILHWGFFLFPILFLQLKNINKSLAILTLATLLLKSILPFLILLFGLNLARLFRLLKNNPNIEILFLELVTFSAISLLIVPEIIFLDDPYGADVDRMNTFFKITFSNWSLMFIAACYSLKDYKFENFLIPIYVVMTAFFFSTISERKAYQDPLSISDNMGLGTLERRYPGAKSAIEFLINQRPGTVIEAQGPPYSETTMIATMVNFPAYLGWVNHIDLLMPDKRDEISHRTSVTQQVYSLELNCEKRRQILESEDISYLVIGELERRAYKNLSKIDLYCLNKIFDNGTYQLYGLRFY